MAQYNLAQAIDRIKQLDDVWVYGLDASPKARPVQQLRLSGGVALVVGNEGEGLRSLVRSGALLTAAEAAGAPRARKGSSTKRVVSHASTPETSSTP